MSYSGDQCKTLFSTQQVYAMKNYLTSTLSNVVANLPIPTISTPTIICSTASISCSDLAPGYAVSNWTTSNSSVATINSDGTLTKVSNGTVGLTAVISQGCTNYYGIASTYVGLPVFTKTVNESSVSTMSVSPGSQYRLAALSNSPNTSYNYNDYYGTGNMTITLYSPNSANAQMYVYSTSTSGQRRVKVTATNTCGTYDEDFVFFVYSSYRTYPNPASESFAVEFASAEEEIMLPDELELISEKTQKTVRKVDVKNLFKKKQLRDGNKIDFEVRDLPRGIYFLNVKNAHQEEDKRVQVLRIALN